jgi:hypothetical protein
MRKRRHTATAAIHLRSRQCVVQCSCTTLSFPVKAGTLNAPLLSYSNYDTKGVHIMPYLLGWLLGVPLIVLVILYLIFH